MENVLLNANELISEIENKYGDIYEWEPAISSVLEFISEKASAKSKIPNKIESTSPNNWIRPCPFCGGVPMIDYYMHLAGPRYRIVCMNCMAVLDPGWCQDQKTAIELWNKRK